MFVSNDSNYCTVLHNREQALCIIRFDLSFLRDFPAFEITTPISQSTSARICHLSRLRDLSTRIYNYFNHARSKATQLTALCHTISCSIPKYLIHYAYCIYYDLCSVLLDGGGGRVVCHRCSPNSFFNSNPCILRRYYKAAKARTRAAVQSKYDSKVTAQYKSKMVKTHTNAHIMHKRLYPTILLRIRIHIFGELLLYLYDVGCLSRTCVI